MGAVRCEIPLFDFNNANIDNFSSGKTPKIAAMVKGNRLIGKVAQNLAHHASVGYESCYDAYRATMWWWRLFSSKSAARTCRAGTCHPWTR